MEIDLAQIKHIHLVGIGGIGVSAIARMWLLEGKQITGSDRSRSVALTELEKLGAMVYEGEDANKVASDVGLLVYSIAVPENNPERVRAKELGIPELSYPEVLGLISRDKFTIAVAGTHGKTTTTAMLASIFVVAGLDPTVIVGSFLKNPDGSLTNFIAGKSKFLIVEACEYRRSFLNLYPQILIITNIDNDHLDYYKDLADIQSAFRELAERVPATGAIVCQPNDPNVSPVLIKVSGKIIDYIAQNVDGLHLKIPGAHNVADAKAALAVGEGLKISPSTAVGALNEFSGTWRRFEFKNKTTAGALVYDDYAHHPSEIKATLAGAREMFPTKKIIVAFQPHLYSRTKLLLADFAQSFGDATEVIVSDIYAAREPNDGTIHSRDLVEKLTANGVKAIYGGSVSDTAKLLATYATDPEAVIITMGAGDIVDAGAKLV